MHGGIEIFRTKTEKFLAWPQGGCYYSLTPIFRQQELIPESPAPDVCPAPFSPWEPGKMICLERRKHTVVKKVLVPLSKIERTLNLSPEKEIISQPEPRIAKPTPIIKPKQKTQFSYAEQELELYKVRQTLKAIRGHGSPQGGSSASDWPNSLKHKGQGW